MSNTELLLCPTPPLTYLKIELIFVSLFGPYDTKTVPFVSKFELFAQVFAKNSKFDDSVFSLPFPHSLI